MDGLTGRGGGGGGGGDRAFSSASRPRPSTSETNLRKLAAGDGMARPGSALGLLQGNNSYLKKKKKTRETTVGISKVVSSKAKTHRVITAADRQVAGAATQQKTAAWFGWAVPVGQLRRAGLGAGNVRYLYIHEKNRP